MDTGGDSSSRSHSGVRKPAMATFVFDGKGGVVRLAEGERAPEVNGKAFVLVSGNLRAPEFKVWLKAELGDFNGDQIALPSLRSRCTVLDDKALVVLRVVRPGASPDDIGRQLLSLWIERGRVIIASELNIPDVLGISQWQQGHHAPLTPADLVARLGLRAADRLEPLVERLADTLDDIEESMMTERPTDSRANLSTLRRNLINFRRLIWPQRDVLNTLEIEDLSFFSPRDRARLREAGSRVARLGDELQALSERAVLVHEQILDSRAEQMNRAMLILAAVTVVFMPLTVISGVLGMNVAGIPFADNPNAFWIVATILAVIGAFSLWIMRFQKWL